MTLKERIAKEQEEEERLGKLCKRCFCRYRGQLCESMTCQARQHWRDRAGVNITGGQSSPPEFELDTTIGAYGRGGGESFHHGTGGGIRVIRSTKSLT